nr:uncharacterized protein LOC118683196 [Bactrocera oleae]
MCLLYQIINAKFLSQKLYILRYSQPVAPRAVPERYREMRTKEWRFLWTQKTGARGKLCMWVKTRKVIQKVKRLIQDFEPLTSTCRDEHNDRNENLMKPAPLYSDLSTTKIVLLRNNSTAAEICS